MDYLGYKATNDPLFKADKTMMRLYSLVPTEYEVDYIEAVETFAENADEASGMAYVSSWGEGKCLLRNASSEMQFTTALSEIFYFSC